MLHSLELLWTVFWQLNRISLTSLFTLRDEQKLWAWAPEDGWRRDGAMAEVNWPWFLAVRLDVRRTPTLTGTIWTSTGRHKSGRAGLPSLGHRPCSQVFHQPQALALTLLAQGFFHAHELLQQIDRVKRREVRQSMQLWVPISAPCASTAECKE